MREYYSVELEATGFADDTFEGTYEECVEYLKDNKYTQKDGRIVKLVDDGDPIVTEIITDWE